MKATSPLPVPTPEAWAAVHGGDRLALDALCTDWSPIVVQWCARLGGPRVDAEQAAQEIFIVLLRRLGTIDGPDKLPAWLFAVTRRVLAQQRRLAWGARWEADADADRLGGGPAPGHDAVDRASTAAAVRTMIRELPPPLREVIALCDLDERTDDEVAALLGVPSGTVKSRLRRARLLLRDMASARGLLPPGEAG
jgi:RNA polymerase sigma-70 factor (ECF subfamily)